MGWDMRLTIPCYFLSDVIGVAKSAGDVQTVTIRSSNREVAKREVSMIDDSGKVVNLTLWGKEVRFHCLCSCFCRKLGPYKRQGFHQGIKHSKFEMKVEKRKALESMTM